MIYYLVMGLIQGLTEWLPVSSSGHLVLIQSIYNTQERTLFDAVLHLGTLAAALLYFRQDIPTLIDLKEKATQRVILASIPIIVAGLMLKDYVEAAFSSPILVSALLIVNGLVVLSNRWIKEGGRAIGTRTALYVGLSQIAALLPGISRSGTTITTARALGLGRSEAARFSFFISFLPILGAVTYKATTAWNEFDPYYILGFIVAFAVGYATIGLMMEMINRRYFHHLGIYTIGLGVMMFLFFTYR